MARSRDRMEDFKDTVRSVALSLGYNESKIASVLASFIMHKPRQKSPFTKAALKTLESIEALEQFIVKHRKDYVDLHRTTEQERDSIEHEIIVFIKACKEQIDILQSRINDDDKSGSSKTWLGMRDNNSHADLVAHRHGVSSPILEVNRPLERLNQEMRTSQRLSNPPPELYIAMQKTRG